MVGSRGGQAGRGKGSPEEAEGRRLPTRPPCLSVQGWSWESQSSAGLDLEEHVKDEKNSFCVKNGFSSSRKALEKRF